MVKGRSSSSDDEETYEPLRLCVGNWIFNKFSPCLSFSIDGWYGLALAALSQRENIFCGKTMMANQPVGVDNWKMMISSSIHYSCFVHTAAGLSKRNLSRVYFKKPLKIVQYNSSFFSDAEFLFVPAGAL
jgi:hypothetical protein